MFCSPCLGWLPFPLPHFHTVTCFLPARCHPKVSCLVGGLEASHSEKRLIRKLVRSTRMCAASVITARLPAICPPVWNTCPHHGSVRKFELIKSNSRLALLWIKGNIQFSVVICNSKPFKVSFISTSLMQWKVWIERNKLNFFVWQSPKDNKSCDILVLWLYFFWTVLLELF